MVNFSVLLKRLKKRLRALFSRRARLAKRVMASKQKRAALPFTHTDSPKLSLILLSFNHRKNIVPIITRLRQTTAEEVIVCDDGSIDGSEKKWLHHLTRPNDFLIRSNDIHEIRSYNRAIDLARGEIVCVLQDDDTPPPNGDWVTDALALFNRHPRLAILGCWVGLSIDFTSLAKAKPSSTLFGHQAEPLRSKWNVTAIPFADPDLHVPFMFVQTIGVGPVFFKKEAFQALGGFDLSFGKPGEPGISCDQDISFKAWLGGYHVGLFEAPGAQIAAGEQGTLMFGKEARKRNKRANLEKLRQRYADKTESIDRIVDELNGQLATRADLP